MRNFISLIVLVLGCIAVSTARADDVLKVGEIYALTGDASADNIIHYTGAQFAADEINSHGGVLGKKLQLIKIDNHSTALGSKLAAEQAVKMGVVAVIGASYSSHSLAMAPVLQQAKIVMISPLATNPDVTLVGDYIFRTCLIDSFIGKIGAQFAYDDLKARSVVVLTNISDKYSLGLSDLFTTAFTQFGGKVVGEEDYLGTMTDFAGILDKVGSLKPDLVFLPGFYKDSALIIKQARAMGIQVKFLGGDGWNDEMYKFGGDTIDGNYFISHWDRLSTAPRSQDFVKRFEAKMGEIKSPGIPLSYDAVYLLADAIRRAHSTDPAKIRDALAATKDFPGVAGDITFDKDRDPIDKPAIIFQMQHGKGVYLKTVAPRAPQ